MTDPADLVRKCVAVAARDSTRETEREAAMNRAAELCRKHGLDQEDFGIVTDYDPETIEAAMHHMDQGWTGEGWKPSELFIIGRSMLSGTRGSEVQARRFERWAIETARELYRAGFYADPFVKKGSMPVPRPGATQKPLPPRLADKLTAPGGSPASRS